VKHIIGGVAGVLLCLVLGGCAGPSIYTAQNFEEYRTVHHTIAILPFQVSIDPKKLPKDFTTEMAEKAEMEEGYNMQQELYMRFLMRQQKGEYTVDFQDVDKTNALLAKSNIAYQQLDELSKEELCQMLSADAIISGSIYRERPMSTGLAVGLGLLFGAWGSTNKVNVTLSIHDRQQGDLVWKYDHEASGSVGSSSEKLAESLMKNVSKKFPYRKPKQE